jgi:S-DNA-T family DNA segregation ATPase FtsK/SpoIIIE
MACYTYSPYDYARTGDVKLAVDNLAGPWGAWFAAHTLGRFGVIGMIWPVFLVFLGGLTATGFMVAPKPRRLIGFVAAAAALSGYSEMLFPLTNLPEPSFGFGGIIGKMIESSFVPQLGFGGTLTALTVLAIVVQVLTGNMSISRTAELIQAGVRKSWKGLKWVCKYIWIRGVLNQDVVSNNGTIAASISVPNPGLQDAHRVSIAPSAGGTRSKKSSAKGAAPASEEPHGFDPNAMELVIDYKGPNTGKPNPSMFSKSKAAPASNRDYKKEGQNISEQLSQFKIEGKVTKVTQGPIVTTYEYEPAPGTKLSKISAMGEDLARMLKAQSLRVLAPIPGKDTVGFEVPNKERGIIGFRDLIENQDFKSTKRQLPIAMGVDIFGKPVISDLTEMPHLLVAGSTGSGKSVFMNTLIGSLVCRHSPKDLRLIMVDPKMVEMAVYNDLPHMACPVITDPQGEALTALNTLVDEMEDRYQRMRAVGARNIIGFNQIIKSKRKGAFPKFSGKWAAMPYVVLIIDEMADMMMMLGKDAERPITRLAQKARACGIHLVIATQRPSAEVVTGLIKANFPTRVAFRVLSGIDSRTILDSSGAETLLGKGDMLHLTSGGTNRVHGAFLPDDEVTQMVKTCAKRR